MNPNEIRALVAASLVVIVVMLIGVWFGAVTLRHVEPAPGHVPTCEASQEVC